MFLLRQPLHRALLTAFYGLWIGFFLLLCPHNSVGQSRDSYEEMDVSWSLADSDCAARIEYHERSYELPHSGQASEVIRFQAGTGTYAHFVTPIDASRIIDELTLSVWVRANRVGLQLAARVVLPRTTDPRTGNPLSTLIRGTTYQEAETWQKLTIALPARMLSQQTALLRSQFGPQVSIREAYLDMLVLNAYGGAGQTELWLDDLEISGQVIAERAGGLPGQAEPAETPRLPNQVSPSRPNATPQLQGSVLTIEGRPRLIRAIDWNGEPYAVLKALGFNSVRLVTPPTPEQLREAQEAGVWLIAPPASNQPLLDYGESLSNIVAWDVGQQLTEEHVDEIRQLTDQLRSVPAERKRALICQPRNEIWQYSRMVDLLVLAPPGPNSSLPLSDFSQWYLQRVRLGRMGAAFWATVQTQLSPAIMRQMTVMLGKSSEPVTLEPDQIRLQVYHAIAAGARGLLFRSSSRLDGIDRLSQLRAKALQRVNQELGIIEPWAATGGHEHLLPTSDPDVTAAVLKTDRSRLVILIRSAPNQQFVIGGGEQRPVTFAVPGVPETDEVYQVGAHGLKRLPQSRNTGMRVTLPKPGLISTLILTQDQLVVNFLAQQVAALRHDQDQLIGDISAQVYSAVVETHQQLLQMIPATGLSPETVDSQSLSLARNELQHYQQLVEGGGHERAFEFLQRGRQQLALTRYQDWSLAVSAFPSPIASPLCVSFFTLPDHYTFGQRLQGAQWGPNSLAGGDFENLSLLQSSGWKNQSLTLPGLKTGVELSLHAPHSGRTALRLQCWPDNSGQAPVVIESPPVSITTGPVEVQSGQILLVRGWARVPEKIHGSLDGLLIYDSITGLDLADRIQLTKDWQEFTLYRAAPANGPFAVTAALSGIGEAWLDDVTVHLLSGRTANARVPLQSESLPR